MERFDRDLKNFFKDGLADVKLTAGQKQNLRRAMVEELAVYQAGWWRRVIHRMEKFMEKTFEIRVAPVAIAAGLAIMLAGAGIFLSEPGVNPEQAPGRVVYMQQTAASPDGSLQITYIPLQKGGTLSVDQG